MRVQSYIVMKGRFMHKCSMKKCALIGLNIATIKHRPDILIIIHESILENLPASIRH